MLTWFKIRCQDIFHRKYWVPNLIAGLVVGIVALPLAMAFAIASGVRPEQGLYTAIIAGIVGAFFGGSPVQISGPTGAFIVILASITAQYGVTGLQVATLMAGCILMLIGIAKLGNIIRFIPDSVVVGFTSGIGVIIFVNEWKDFFGLQPSPALTQHFHEKLILLLQSFSTIHIPTLALGCLALTLLLVTPKFTKRIPGALIAMAVVTLLQVHFKFEGVATIGSMFGGIPQRLPSFAFPSISIEQCLELVGPAFTIALLGAIESLLSAVVADGMSGTRHQANQELIGQGLANIISPLFGGFATTGAIARTATNIRNGANSPLASLIHSVTLIIIILFLAPLAFYIPLSALAAILFVVAYNMSEVPHVVYILKHAPLHDVVVLVTTFLLTVFTDLVVAVNVGVILALALFARRMSQSVSIELDDTTDLQAQLSKHNITLPSDTLIYTLQGPFFFGAAETFEHTLSATHTDPKTIIFRLKYVPFMDLTGLQTFYEIIENFSKRKVKVYLCGANPRVVKKLEKMDILSLIEGNKVYNSLLEIFIDQSLLPSQQNIIINQ